MAHLIEDTPRGPKADDSKPEKKDPEPQLNDSDPKPEEKDPEPQMQCNGCKRKSNEIDIGWCKECQKMTCIRCCGQQFENLVKFGGSWMKCTQMRCAECVAKFEDMLEEYDEDYNEQELLDEYHEYIFEIHMNERFLDNKKKRTKWSYESNHFEFK